MGDQRAGGIAWTDETWNPVRGCSRVSEGCRNCYAERIAARFCGPGMPYEGLAKITAPRDALDRVGGRRNGWTGVVRMVPEHLADPLKWKRPRRVFVNSMSDLFHEKLSDEDIALVWATMVLAPRHTFQVLTKRAGRMRDLLNDPAFYQRVLWASGKLRQEQPELLGVGISDPRLHPARWIWLGVSVEDQRRADERIPLLLDTPAAVRFVSAEPLLERVSLRQSCGIAKDRALARFLNDTHICRRGTIGEARLDWVIVGAESGRGARPMDLDWARVLRDECVADGRVRFFLKQTADAHGHKISTPELDGRRWVEFPEAA